jgi:hypothetical protein
LNQFGAGRYIGSISTDAVAWKCPVPRIVVAEVTFGAYFEEEPEIEKYNRAPCEG